MQLFIAASLCLFGICITTAEIEMGPLSKSNTYTLIREVNSSLELYCRSNDSAGLLITHCYNTSFCDNVTTENGQGSEVIVRFSSLKFNDSGTYFCRDSLQLEKLYIQLKVGVKPELPETVDCVSPDLTELSCNWNKTEAQILNFVPTSWEIKFKWKPFGSTNFSEKTESCPNETVTDSSIKCRWPPDSEQFGAMREYKIYLTGKNQLGNVTETYNINPENYAKLSIQKLQLRPSATSLLVTWSLNDQVYLRRAGDIVFETSLENLSSNQKNFGVWNKTITESYEEEILGLQPCTRYKFCMKTRLFLDRGVWSESKCKETDTDESAPTHAPETDRWAYNIENASNRLQLYLKEVPPCRTSKNYSYSITKDEGNQLIINFTAISPNTVRIANLSSQFAGTIFIRSCNDKGCSNASAQVNIDYTRTEFRPRSVIVSKITNNKQYTVSCEENEANIQYTIFYYCCGFRESNICQSDFGWDTKRGVQSNHTIQVPSTCSDGDWIFGVAIVAKDNTSGGIVFASCYSTVNNICVHSSQLHSGSPADFPEEYLIVILIILCIAFIFMVWFILRCLKQGYCEEIKIELPDLFLNRNDQRNTLSDPHGVSYRYAGSNSEHSARYDECRGSNDNKGVDRVNSFKVDSIHFKHLDSVCRDEVIGKMGEPPECVKKLEQRLSLTISPAQTDCTNLDDKHENDDDCTQTLVMVAKESVLVDTNEDYVTNEEYIKEKQGKDEQLKEDEDLLPQGYARCTNGSDFSKLIKQSSLECDMSSTETNNDVVLGELDFASHSDGSSSVNLENEPFLFNPSLEFK